MKSNERQFFKSAPNISKVESQYSAQEQTVDNLGDKISKNLENRNDISEQDKIRLTRILQLLDKYKPNRKINEKEKICS